jgi:hypothetical protein
MPVFRIRINLRLSISWGVLDLAVSLVDVDQANLPCNVMRAKDASTISAALDYQSYAIPAFASNSRTGL